MKRITGIVFLMIFVLLTGCTSELSVGTVKNVSFSETVKEEFFELEMKGYEYRDTVEPENPSGYYHYFEANDDAHYLVFEGMLNNISGETLDLDNVSSDVSIENKDYECVIRTQTEGASDFLSQIEKDKELRIIVLAKVPADVQEAPQKLILRYNDMFRKSSESNQYQYELDMSVESK